MWTVMLSCNSQLCVIVSLLGEVIALGDRLLLLSR